MSTNSLVILICGLVAMVVLVFLILFIGSRRKTQRAGNTHTTPAPTTTERTTRHREES